MERYILTSYVKANFGTAGHGSCCVCWMYCNTSYRMTVSWSLSKNVADTLGRPSPRIINLSWVYLWPQAPDFRFTEIPDRKHYNLHFQWIEELIYKCNSDDDVMILRAQFPSVYPGSLVSPNLSKISSNFDCFEDFTDRVDEGESGDAILKSQTSFRALLLQSLKCLQLRGVRRDRLSRWEI